MKTERVFITGCGGMLGNAIYPFFKSWYGDVLATDKIVSEDWLSKLDVRDSEGLRKILAEYKPDIILHLAAETDLEYCETHPEITQATNATATETIARLAEEHGATLIYISTAGVFDGKKPGYYSEEDTPHPLMVYGQTKYEGELHTLKYCSKSYVVRAGWMMGGGRRKEKKFIYKILQQVAEGKKEIFAVDDKWGTPTYTYDFAMNLFLLLETKKYGLYHMVCEGKGTRYDVAKEILRISNHQDITLTRVGSDFFAEEYFAPRPFSEIMINNKLSELGINHMRPWHDALRDYIENHFADYINNSPELSEKKILPSPKKESTASDGFTERRSTYRKDYPSSVEYVVHNGSDFQSKQSSKKAIMVNVSNEGICLYTFNPVNKGEQISLLQRPSGVEQEIATVQWIRQEKSGVFKAGLMFQDKG